MDSTRDRRYSTVWVAVGHPQDPEPGDGGLQLCHGVDLRVLQLGLHPGPAVLDGVEVWAVAWPVDQCAYPVFVDWAGLRGKLPPAGPGDQLLTEY